METFSALLAICAGNSPVPGEFPAQRPMTRSFDVFFDLQPNKRLSKQWWGWWFETPSSPLWRHCNENCQCDQQKVLLAYDKTSIFETIFNALKQSCSQNGACDSNRDVIIWTRIPHYWPFVRESTATGGFPSQRTSYTKHLCFLRYSLNKFLNQRCSYETSQRSYCVTVMSRPIVYPLSMVVNIVWTNERSRYICNRSSHWPRHCQDIEKDHWGCFNIVYFFETYFQVIRDAEVILQVYFAKSFYELIFHFLWNWS